MPDSQLTKRQFHRWYFQSKEIPLSYQSTGIPVRTYGSLMGLKRPIGQGVIKDISLGGLGFLGQPDLPKKVQLKLPNGEMIACEILHRFMVNKRLTFYGANWGKAEYQRVLPLLRQFSREAFRQSMASEDY